MGWWSLDSHNKEHSGDESADVMGKALEDIIAIYHETWKRNPTYNELRFAFDFTAKTAIEMGNEKLEKE